MALTVIVAGVTVPQLLVGVERARARAAARYLTAQVGFVRTQAVGRGATVALRFEHIEDGTALSVVLDGNGNGIRLQDLEEGLDTEVQPPVRLEDLFPGVSIARPPDAGEPALQLGGTSFLSFTPSGTSTSGSIYVLGRDGSQFAVRVLGITGRVRLLRYDARSGQWVDSL